MLQLGRVYLSVDFLFWCNTLLLGFLFSFDFSHSLNNMLFPRRDTNPVQQMI